VAESFGSVSGLETSRFQQNASAGGGAFSTVMDMATFAQMFLDRGRHGEVRI